MPLAAGTVIGRYELRSLIGAGGMGEVYLARDSQLKRAVALKVLPADVAADEDRMRRFTQEARAASSLNHPNILTIYEIGASGEAHFIATEYIEGLTLRRLMSNAPIGLGESFDITIQVAAALAVAHAAGIVHRDIKPENVMLRTDGYVKVLDFGLAKLTEKFGDPRAGGPGASTHRDVITSPGVVMGTVYYMSPEQARGLEVDARTDIWSLGVVLYELIANRTPFTGSTGSDVIAAILEKQIPPLTLYLPHAPAELLRIVNKALAKDRDERYQTVQDLLIDLKHLKRDLESEPGQENSPRGARGRNQEGSGRGVSGESAGREGEGAKRESGWGLIASAEYIAGGLKRHRKGAALTLALLTSALTILLYSLFPAGSPVDSVAILPFVNSAGPEMELLGEGLTDSVINNLTAAGVKVKSRHTVFTYKGKEADPRKIGHELGVSAVLTGSIQKQGDALIIKTALVDVADDFQLWGKQYPIYDLVGGTRFLVLQEDISKQITDEVQKKIVSGGKKP